MSFVIPRDECSLTDLKRFREDAVESGIQRALELRIATHRKQLVARGFQNIADAGTALDQWRTAALAVIGTEYSCFQAVATVTLPANKLFVFYKVGVESVPMPVSLLRFRHNAINGNIMANFDLEQLTNSLVCEGYFSEPVVIDPSATFAANVIARVVAGWQRVQLGCWVIEPVGGNIA